MKRTVIKQSTWGMTVGLFVLASITLSVPVPAAAGGDTVIIMRHDDARMYDLHKKLSRSTSEPLFMMTDTLVAIEDDLKTIRPSLVKSWTISPDGGTYTFKLCEDVIFYSGKPMTAEDVEYTFKRWLSPETNSPSVGRAGPMKEVRAIDKYTVEITLEKPFAGFLPQLAVAYAGITNKESVERFGKDFGLKGLDGTGPFRWEKWIPRDQIILRRHDAYRWGPPMFDNSGPAHVERIIWKVIPEDTARVASLLSGQGDISYNIPLSAVQQLRAASNISIVEPRAFGWIAYIGFRIDRELVSDPRVRRAMWLAVDRDTMMKTLWFNEAAPAHAFCPPTTPGYDKSIDSKLVRYNPAKASQLLEEAGWKIGGDGFRYKDGKKLAPILYGQDDPFWRSRMEAVQGYLRTVGVDLQLKLWEPTLGSAKIQSGEGHEMWALFGAYGSVAELLGNYFSPGQRMCAYLAKPDEEVVALMRAGASAETPEKSFANYAKALNLIHDRSYWLPLAYEKMLVSYNNRRVTGVNRHGINGCGLYKGLDIKIVK